MALTTATGLDNPAYQYSVDDINALVNRALEMPSLSDYSGETDTAKLEAAIADAASNNTTALFIPPGSYTITTQIEADVDNLNFFGGGATLNYTGSAGTSLFYIPTAEGVKFHGLTTVIPSGTAAQHFNIYGANCSLLDCVMEHSTATDTIGVYVRDSAPGFRMLDCRMEGMNEKVNIFCGNALFDNNDFIGSASLGGDDCIAIKAIEDTVENIRVTNNRVSYHASVVGFGSQIGKQGADDSDYTGRVRCVLIGNNTANNCASLVYIKPGAVAVDYRNGLVEAVRIRDNTLYDPEGVAFQMGLRITAGRGAWVRDIKGDGNVIVARASGTVSTGHKCVMDIFGINSGAAPIIEDIDVGFSFNDPYDGAANGTAGVPAHPVVNFVNVENANTNGITLDRINLRLDANGCSQSGVIVGSGFDGAVTVEKLHMTNANASSHASHGGFKTASAITVMTDNITIDANVADKVTDSGGSFAANTNPLLA